MKKKAAKPPPTTKENTGQIMSFFTFFGVLVFVFHLLALWYRWLRPDPEFLDFTAWVIEILAIGSFLGLQTEIGRKFVIRFDESFFLTRILNSQNKRLITCWVLAIIAALILWVGSPIAAEGYRTRGVSALEVGDNSQGIRYFNQAISLDSDNARSHYNLATAYENLNRFDEAITEYQISLEMEESFWPTYNNLGRLLTMEQGDFDEAINILLAGQNGTEDQLGKAVITKNLAWAYLNKHMPNTAMDTLQESIMVQLQLRGEGVPTEIYLTESFHLQALIFTELENEEAAVSSWQNSVGYGLSITESRECSAEDIRLPQYCLDAIKWVVEAKESLRR